MFHIKQVKTAFFKRYSRVPQHVVRAPGRVNLIGEHTDYNNGYVFPLAIDHYVWIAGLCHKDTNTITVFSENLQKQEEITLGNIPLDQVLEKNWPSYIQGVVYEYQKVNKNTILGGYWVIQSDLPMGAGLSSSAALELASARMLCNFSNTRWNSEIMAQMCQKAEHIWVGVHCGIMDQMACACSKPSHALLLDCQSLKKEHIPWPHDLDIIVMDTMTRRDLAESAYNTRRQECEQAAKLCKVSTLRDISWNQFQQIPISLLPENLYRRAKHVVSENQRVLATANALKSKDWMSLKKMLIASHQSLRDDFQVCNQALNIMVEIANTYPHCYGSRMTGAGFGGCAIAVIPKDKAKEFCHYVGKEYEKQMNLVPQIYICQVRGGLKMTKK